MATDMSLRIVIITAPDRLEQEWITRLSNEAIIGRIDRVGVVKAGLEMVQQTRPDVVLVDREIDQAEACIRQIFTTLPATQCIAIVPNLDVIAMRRLVTAGARDMVARPVRYADILNSIQSVATTEADRRARSLVPAGNNTHGAGNGRLIVVTSPKGGAGTTTIATNIAVALRQMSSSRVVLADFGLQFGDIGVQLNLWSKHTLHDLLTRVDELDDAMLQPVIQQHATGIHVLLAPNSPEVAGDITSEQVDKLLDELLERYTYVVVDTWSFLDEVSSALLRRAHDVLVVATPEVPALKNVKRFLEFVRQENLVQGRITLILNRFPSVNGIALEDVQQHLRQTVGANIPSDGRLVTHSVNRGIPIVISHPDSWVAQSLSRIAAHMAGEQISTLMLAPAPKRGKGRKDDAPKTRWTLRRLIGRETTPSST